MSFDHFDDESKEVIKEMKNAVIHIRIPYKWKEICKESAKDLRFPTMSQYCVALIKLDYYYRHAIWPKNIEAIESGRVLSESEFLKKLAYEKAFEEQFRRDAKGSRYAFHSPADAPKMSEEPLILKPSKKTIIYKTDYVQTEEEKEDDIF